MNGKKMFFKRQLLVITALLTIHSIYAQYMEIPHRLDTCTNCSGTGINPNYCRICHGTGQYGIRRVYERCPACAGGDKNCRYCGGTDVKSRIYPEMCRACAGGLPYKCRYCNNGLANIVDICKGQLKRQIPLWNYLDCVEDIYFIGDATINETYTIKKHKICKVNRGTIQMQNLKFTSVIYGRDSIVSKTNGMIGMLDYEDDYILKGGWSISDSIILCHIHEPQMQRFLRHDKDPIGKKQSYKTIWVNDSTFTGDMTYIVTPTHITCGHHEYYFRNGILTKKLSHGKAYCYKYLEFDDRGNWLSRDEFCESDIEPHRQIRTIKYLK